MYLPYCHFMLLVFIWKFIWCNHAHLVSSCELLQGQCGLDFMIAVNLSVVFNVGCGFTTVLWQVSIQGVLLRSFQAVSTHALR